MTGSTYIVSGLMSGSSMDGVDLCTSEFVWNGQQWNFKILAAVTVPYGAGLLSKLKEACTWTLKKINELDLELGSYYAGLLNDFHREYSLRPDYIASHGHTILHEPDRGITLQAGNGRVMADRTGITVISDFRSEDVAQGGQGAPLVPIGDRLLFSQYQACLNLGGFANISFDNPRGERIAYDLCPANMALNWVASLAGLDYDKHGALARKGSIDRQLLARLNQLDFYDAPPPKSLGREWFLEFFLPPMQASGLATTDLMATVAEHIAVQISADANSSGIESILVTGGGALNQNLIERLEHYTTASLVIPGLNIVNYKEALIFAFLGVLRIRNEVNCLASVTGGKKDISAGTIHKT